jgi:hypothetical protein
MGNAFLLASVWRLGGKHLDGWALNIVGNLLWTWYGVSNGLWPVVFIDGTMLLMAINNLRKWR